MRSEEDEETSDFEDSDFKKDSKSDDEVVEDEDEDADDDVEFQDSGAQREESTELGLIRDLLLNTETTTEERQILLTLEEMNTENYNVEESETIRNAKNILVYFLLVGRIKPIKTREIRNQAESTIFKDLFKLKFVDANKLNRTAPGLNRIWKERIFFSTLIDRLIKYQLLITDDDPQSQRKKLLENLKSLSPNQPGFTETRFLLLYQDVPVLTGVLNFVFGPIANLKDLKDKLEEQEGDTFDDKYGNYYRNVYRTIIQQSRPTKKRQRLSVLKF